MRKALIAVVVASALFAVGAFAASFAVQSEDIASGGNAVEACASNVDIDFTTPVVNSTSGLWEVTGATVNFLTAAAAPDSGCDGWDAELALRVGATTSTVDTATVNGSSAAFTFTATSVEQITSASVMVNGKTLTDDAIATP